MIKEITPGGQEFYIIGVHELNDLAKFSGKNIIVLAKTLEELDPKAYDQLKQIKNKAKQVAIVVSEETVIQLGIISRDVPMLSVIFFTLVNAKTSFDSSDLG